MSVQSIVCLLAFGYILLLSNTALCHVINGVEERLSALESQGQEQGLVLIQQGQEIQQLNAELKFYKEQLNKYKQQNDDQETKIAEQTAMLQDNKDLAIQNQRELANYKTQLAKQEITIAEQTAMLQDYKKLAIQNQKELTSYKTQITKQERRMKALEEALIVDKATHVDQRSESDYTNDGIGIEDSEMKFTDNNTHQQDDINGATHTYRRLAMRNIASPVAFHATTDQNQVTHIGVNQNLALDVVLLNIGNGYHNQNGLFIAPVAGVYSFSTSILSSTNSTHPFINLNIMKNGQVLGTAYAHGEDNHNDQGAITVVTQLKQGDEVWVADKWPADTSYYGERYTSFSGFLLY